MTEGEKVDGRRARGIRTRDAIVSALMDLIAGGDIAPTAQRIADRAGVSVRSVYQHFTDVEGLYADASARTFDWVKSATKEVDPRWPLERRIDEYTAIRATTLETMTPFSRAARLIEPTSSAIRKSRLEMQRWGRDRIARIFASELEKLEGSERSSLLAALDTMSSAEAWEHLRTSGHGVKSARQIVRTGMVALLAGTGG
ncbi:MAG TPA: TetR/AcrR family transcriptional regulator [Acidimicrobiales bacterium]|nr:TetR/AcrR family transcriptional regulator [Acidimicrobiales bacterium]